MTRQEDLKIIQLFRKIQNALNLSKLEFEVNSDSNYVSNNIVEYSGVFETLYRNVWISVELQSRGVVIEYYSIFMCGETHNGHKEKTFWGSALYNPQSNVWDITPISYQSPEIGTLINL